MKSKYQDRLVNDFLNKLHPSVRADIEAIVKFKNSIIRDWSREHHKLMSQQ